ncbi:RluA family pseudouridine synthase [Peribacillus sp. B-H-3]|uniref:RluA family pseudouridine synthase n=1 Tax=Peribacillus sp. B-H-3 TaxID=3400420 RepID=UPI003B0249E4
MSNNSSKQHFTLSWRVEKGQSGKLLREFLSGRDISKRALTAIKFGGGRILVNGIEATVRYSLHEGDQVEVHFPPEAGSEGLKAERLPLSIKYEDDYVMVLVKPPYMNTIPSREHPEGSLANALAGYYQEKGLLSTVHVVTRLDRDTSGLLLIAKHRHVHHLFSEQQKAGGVKRTYDAVAEGSISCESGRIEAPIGRNPDSIIEREVREDGQYACTLYQVMGYYDGYCHVKLRLLTGRTHQIRVHLSHLGHPLAGDDLYGGSRQAILRQALHCSQLTFYHPFLEKELTFSEPLPEDMKKLLASIKRL